MLKAVNYDGEMFIIEEVQLFQPPEPIKILKFSNVTVLLIIFKSLFKGMFIVYYSKAHST